MSRAKVAACGTTSGYRRHLQRSEPPCDSCKSAQAAYMRDYKRTHRDYVANDVRLRAARRRAALRIANEQPEKFDAYTLEEMQK